MEIPDIGQSDVFTKSEKFEINEYEFRHIRVDRHRISAQGVGLAILLWLFVKRESLILFTPGGMFKIEGSASFVESLWAKIAQLQREKDQ